MIDHEENTLVEMIDAAACAAEYKRLGYSAGYSFGMTPTRNLRTADVLIVGLNPGGDWGEEIWEVASGNAYLDERWGEASSLNPLQVEVIALLDLLGVTGEQVFAGQFIPFRSPSFAALERRDEAISFGRRLWTWVLSQTPARLMVCMGYDAAWHIAQLCGAVQVDTYPTGWGTTVACRFIAPDGRVVVSIPHPSRYKLLGPGRGTAERRRAKLAILSAARPVPEVEAEVA